MDHSHNPPLGLGDVPRRRGLGTDASSRTGAALTVRNPFETRTQGKDPARRREWQRPQRVVVVSRHRRRSRRRRGRRTREPARDTDSPCSPVPSRSAPLLVRRGLVSEDDVAQALVIQNETGKRIGETLVAMGAMNERELTLFLADLLHMPVVDLRRDNPQPDVLALIPERLSASTWRCRSNWTTTACKWPSLISRRSASVPF